MELDSVLTTLWLDVEQAEIGRCNVYSIYEAVNKKTFFGHLKISYEWDTCL